MARTTFAQLDESFRVSFGKFVDASRVLLLLDERDAARQGPMLRHF